MKSCFRYVNGRAYVLDIRDKQLNAFIRSILVTIKVRYQRQQGVSSPLPDRKLLFSLLSVVYVSRNEDRHSSELNDSRLWHGGSRSPHKLSILHPHPMTSRLGRCHLHRLSTISRTLSTPLFLLQQIPSH
jgi:hypothetical protein